MPSSNSPYFDGGNVGAGWGPPAGLAQMLAQRDEELQNASKSIGKMAGGLGAGVVGAFQGAANPEVFGAGTSKSSGAFKGFAQNFVSDYGGGGKGGGGGSAASGIGALMGQGGGSTPNFKQLAEAGKTADAFRKMMRASTPTLPGEDPNIFGMSDDQWNAAGSHDKAGVLQAYAQSLKTQGVQQGLEQGKANTLMALAHAKEYTDQAAQRSADTTANARFAAMSRTGSFDGPGSGLFGPIRSPVMPTVEQVSRAALANPDAPDARPFLAALARQQSAIPGETPGIARAVEGAPGYAYVPLSRNGSGTVISLPKSVDTSVEPKIIEFGNGRQGFRDPANNNKITIFPERAARPMAAGVATMISAIETRHANALLDAEDPNLAADKRKAARDSANRYGAQLEALDKRYNSPVAGPSGAPPGDLFQQYLDNKDKQPK